MNRTVHEQDCSYYKHRKWSWMILEVLDKLRLCPRLLMNIHFGFNHQEHQKIQGFCQDHR